MKKKLLFLPLLAAWAMTGCSSDEPAGNNGPEGNGENSYLAVNIVSPKTLFGKATDGGFEDTPEANENAAETAMFLFFDQDGNCTQSPQMVDLKDKWTETSKTDPQVEKISSAVLVIAGSTSPDQMLVILNPPTNAYQNANGKSLSTIRSLFSDKYGINVVAKEGAAPDSTFIMTNSTYVVSEDGSKSEVCAVKITNIAQKTPELAATNPVNVYVERNVAKVLVSAVPEHKQGTADEPFAEPYSLKIDNEEVTLHPVIKAVEIANIPFSTFLFKSLGNNYTNWPDILLDANNKRCYWAECPDRVVMTNKSYNQISDAPESGHKYYVHENTTGSKTSVLLTAELQDEEGNPVTFLFWGGTYYKKDGFLSQYARLLENGDFRIRTTDGWRNITENELEWIDETDHKNYTMENQLSGNEYKLEDYEMTAKVKTLTAGGEFYEWYDPSISDWKEVNINSLNNYLRLKKNRVWIWNEGKCYYFVNIEHLGAGDYAEGVVRNHIYDLNLCSLKGLGTPVYFPDEEIVPTKPTSDLYYLDAVINILKWKVVKQDVNFE